MSEQTNAEKIYEKVEEVPDASSRHQVEQRTTADMLYGEGAIKQGGIYDIALKDGLDKMSDNLGLSNAQREEARAASAKLFYDTGMSPADASQFHRYFAHYTVNPADQETRQAWGVETRQKVRELYGARGEGLLASAREYVRKAGLAESMDRSGLGNHPETVLKLVEQVTRLKR